MPQSEDQSATSHAEKRKNGFLDLAIASPRAQCGGNRLKCSESFRVIESYTLPQSSTLTPDGLFFDHSFSLSTLCRAERVIEMASERRTLRQQSTF